MCGLSWLASSPQPVRFIVLSISSLLFLRSVAFPSKSDQSARSQKQPAPGPHDGGEKSDFPLPPSCGGGFIGPLRELDLSFGAGGEPSEASKGEGLSSGERWLPSQQRKMLEGQNLVGRKGQGWRRTEREQQLIMAVAPGPALCRVSLPEGRPRGSHPSEHQEGPKAWLSQLALNSKQCVRLMSHCHQRLSTSPMMETRVDSSSAVSQSCEVSQSASFFVPLF